MKIIRWIFQNEPEFITIGFMLFQYVFIELSISKFWLNYWMWWDDEGVAKVTYIFRIGYVVMKNAYVLSVILFMFSLKIGVRRKIKHGK